MTNELDTWLFNHAQLMGNQCDGIKDETGTNFAWQDTVTKEVFVIGMHELQAKVEELEDERMDAAMLDLYRIWEAEASNKVKKLQATIEANYMAMNKQAVRIKELEAAQTEAVEYLERKGTPYVNSALAALKQEGE